MADKNDPVAELTNEARQRLDAMEKEIERSQQDVSALEELGLDVSTLREKLDWAKKAHKIIKERLTK